MTYEEFNQKLANLNMSLFDFAIKSNMSIKTVTNWKYNVNKSPVPSWVDPFLELFINSQNCNNQIIINSLFFRLSQKKEEEIINRYQDVIVLMHRAFLPFQNDNNIEFSRLRAIIIDYDLRLFKDVALDFITTKTKTKAINFLEELEDEEKYFICHNLNIFLRILWQTRTVNNLSIFTGDSVTELT